jgi:amino acid transporter
VSSTRSRSSPASRPAARLGEESKALSKVIPLAVAGSLVVVARYEIGVAAVATNASPNGKALVAAVPLVTVTDTYVAGWLGILVAFGAAVSSFGAALARANGAARLLFALGRDGFGPASLRRTSARTGAPLGAFVWVAVVSLGAFAAFSWEHDAIRAVDIILTYGADLIIVAYILVVVAAIVYTIRSRMSPVKTIILLIGAGILGYVVKSTFLPFPAAPYNWVALVAGVSLVVGLVLPVASRRVREGVRSSPLLRLGTTRLLPGVAEGDGEARRTGAA